MKIKITLTLSLLLFAFSHSQSGHGLSFDNYNSIYGLTINPAFSVESKAKWQVNGLSYSNLNFTDVGEISSLNFKYLSTPNGFDGIDYESNFPSEETPNNAHIERDWMLPSVIYKFNDNISAGLILRSRAIVNYSNFNGPLFELTNNGELTNASTDNYPTNAFNFTNTAHYWSEVGLNFAVSLLNKNNHVIKIGATAKWLRGQGVINVQANDLQSNISAPNELELENGTVTYLNTFKEDDEPEANIILGPFQNFFNSTSTSSNFGGDAGLVWEIRTSNTNRLDRGVSESAVNLYKAKIAASVLDVGYINYDTDQNDTSAANLGVLNDTYTVAGLNVPFSDFQQRNLIEVLEQNASSSEVERSQPRGEVKIALPTTFNLNVDYLLNSNKNYYLNINYLQPLRENIEEFSNQRMQLVTVTPRIEKPDWSVYLPLSVGIESDWAVGIGGRFKYVTAGFSIPELGGVNYLYFGFNAPLIKL